MNINAHDLIQHAAFAYDHYPQVKASVETAYSKIGMKICGTHLLNKVRFVRWTSPSHLMFTAKEFGAVHSTSYSNVVVDEIMRATDNELVPYQKFVTQLKDIEESTRDDEMIQSMVKTARNMLLSRLPNAIRDGIVERINIRVLKDAEKILDAGNVIIAIDCDDIYYTGQAMSVNATSQTDESVSAMVTLNNAFFCCSGDFKSSGLRRVRKDSKSSDYVRRKAYEMIKKGLGE